MMQINSNWRPDTPSLLLGVVLGIVLMTAVFWLRPTFLRWYRRGRGWIEGKLSWMRSGVETRFQGETVKYAQKLLVDWRWLATDPFFVPPRLLAAGDIVPAKDRGATETAVLFPECAVKMGSPLLPSMGVDYLLQNGRRVLISGQAGAGKSTLLAHLTHRLAAADPQGVDKAFAPVMPLHLHLAEIEWPPADPDAPEESSSLELLTNALQKRSNPLTTAGLGDLIERKLAAGEALLLLDGWNELAAGKRPLILKWLHGLLTQFGQARVFMTTALDGYGALLSFGFTRTRLLPWRMGQVQELAAHWQNVFSLDEAVPDLSNFWQPGMSAVETHWRLFDLLLGADTESAAGLPPVTRLLPNLLPYTMKQKQADLAEMPDPLILTFWRQLAGRLLIQEEIALNAGELNEVATQLATAADEVDKTVLGRLRKSLMQSPLFRIWGNGRVSFRNTLWRDYFGAAYLVQNPDKKLLRQHLADPQWRMMFCFYAAEVDVSGLVKQLLQSEPNPPYDGLIQAASWMPFSSGLVEWRRQIMTALGKLSRAKTAPYSLRLRAAAAMVHTQEPGLLQYVTQLLGRSDSFLRQMGTAVLPLLPHDKIISLLAERLLDEDPLVRQTAVYGLAQLQHRSLTERPLITALIGDDEALGLQTAVCLGQNGEAGTTILKEALQDEDIQVRRAAVHGLSMVDEAWVERLLQDRERHDEEWFVRSATSGALEMIRQRRQPQPWRPVNVADDPLLADFAVRIGEPVPHGRAAIPFMLKMFSDTSEVNSRAALAYLLAKLPAKKAIPELTAAIESEETAVREAAFYAVATLLRAYSDVH
ncbi:MAG: NACHT domain-containing protein [Chloroflexi bacterium]|nr:NACHT domain-containing protein [Chloroflexota bacterium]